MLDREFQDQILDTPEQWKSGLAVGLNVDASGLSLFLTPSFETWLDRSGAGGDIVTDDKGSGSQQFFGIFSSELFVFAPAIRTSRGFASRPAGWFA